MRWFDPGDAEKFRSILRIRARFGVIRRRLSQPHLRLLLLRESPRPAGRAGRELLGVADDADFDDAAIHAERSVDCGEHGEAGHAQNAASSASRRCPTPPRTSTQFSLPNSCSSREETECEMKSAQRIT